MSVTPSTVSPKDYLMTLLAEEGLSIDPENRELSLHDLEIDSLALIEITMKLEEKFDVEIESDDLLAPDSTIDDFCSVIRAKMDNNA